MARNASLICDFANLRIARLTAIDAERYQTLLAAGVIVVSQRTKRQCSLKVNLSTSAGFEAADAAIRALGGLGYTREGEAHLPLILLTPTSYDLVNADRALPERPEPSVPGWASRW